MQVGGHAGFVGSIQDARDIAFFFQGFKRQSQGGESVQVGFLEGQGAQGGEIQFPVVERQALGETECQLDGLAHVRAAQLGQDGPVFKFDHGVDDRFGVYHYVDAVGSGAEEPAGLDDLESFVHHRSGIDGDFGAHRPVGMLEGVGLRCGCNLLLRPIAERASGGCEMYFFEFVSLGGEQALEDGRMLGIYREDGGVAGPGPLHHQGSGSYQGLLVGQGDDLARLDGRQGGAQAAESNHGSNDDIHPVGCGQAASRVDAAEYLAVRIGQGVADLGIFVGIADDDVVDVKLARLFDQQVTAVVGGNEFHVETVRMLPDHIQGLAADGPGGTEDGNVSFSHQKLI